MLPKPEVISEYFFRVERNRRIFLFECEFIWNFIRETVVRLTQIFFAAPAFRFPISRQSRLFLFSRLRWDDFAAAKIGGKAKKQQIIFSYFLENTATAQSNGLEIRIPWSQRQRALANEMWLIIPPPKRKEGKKLNYPRPWKTDFYFLLWVFFCCFWGRTKNHDLRPMRLEMRTQRRGENWRGISDEIFPPFPKFLFWREKVKTLSNMAICFQSVLFPSKIIIQKIVSASCFLDPK